MDNLPIPQSRIENLMNAFISRDSSRISAPQSRVEEFWYHLIEGTNSLPIPQSRIELLLKKIIENDTEQIPLAQSRAEEFLVSILTGDINKLPIPQSRSEHYLDYIARNNLVLDDIEYLKYNGTNITATNTVQKPFKSAILTGQTLVNLLNFNSITSNGSKEGDTITVSANGNTSAWLGTHIYLSRAIERGKKYIVMWNNLEYTHSHANGKMAVIQVFTTNTSTNRDLKLGQTENDDKNYMIFSCNDDNGDLNKVKIAIKANTWATEEANNTTIVKGLKVLEYRDGMENWDIPYFEGMQSVKTPVLTTSNEDGTKTNILTVNEDVELRGIGNVQDTLDLLTGEVTERIGETVLDGSENWNYHENLSTDALAVFSVYNNFGYLEWLGAGSILCDKFPVTQKRATDSNAQEGIYDKDGWAGKNKIPLIINKDRLSSVSVDGLKLWLSNNHLKLQFKLQNKSIKTVDLKVVDQDGNPVKKLSAFDETTHIVSSSASDNSLIAIAEVEVPTKLIEALNDVKSLSSDVEILINEVDNAQKLQDENSTMVMSAMTELYEMVLVMGGGS